MTAIILTFTLAIALAVYRQTNRTSRYLYKRWAWIQFMDARVDAMKAEIGLAFMPAFENAVNNLAKAAGAAAFSVSEFGDAALEFGKVAGVKVNINFDGYQWVSGTGRER